MGLSESRLERWVESALPKIGSYARREREGSVQGCSTMFPFFPLLFFFVPSFRIFVFPRVSDIAKERRGGRSEFFARFRVVGFLFFFFFFLKIIKKERERGLRGRKEIRVV